MDTDARTTPIHLWVVGGIATLWNAFGCYDYLMTRTQGAAYINAMMHTNDGAAIMAYIDAFPIWVSFFWGIGVWGGLAGSILLVMRHRWAVPLLLISAVGATLGIGYQLIAPSGIPEMSTGVNAIMPYVIVAIAIGLFIYARAMRSRGVLR